MILEHTTIPSYFWDGHRVKAQIFQGWLPPKTWAQSLLRGSFSDVAVMFFSAMSQVKNDNFRAIIEPFLTHSYVLDLVFDLWTVDSVDGWDAQVLGGNDDFKLNPCHCCLHQKDASGPQDFPLINGGHGGDFGPQYHLGCYLRQPLGMEPLILSQLRKQDPGFRPKVQEIEHGTEHIEQIKCSTWLKLKVPKKDGSPKSISLTSPCFNSLHRGGTCLFQWHGQGGTCIRGFTWKDGGTAAQLLWFSLRRISYLEKL